LRPVQWTLAQRSSSLTARPTSQRMYLFLRPTAAWRRVWTRVMEDKMLELVGPAAVVMPGCQMLLTVSPMFLWVARMAERLAAQAAAAMPGRQMPLTVSPMFRSVAPVAVAARAAIPARAARQAPVARELVAQQPVAQTAAAAALEESARVALSELVGRRPGVRKAQLSV